MSQPTAAEALDQIRLGGIQLVAIAKERLRDCEVALSEGRFEDALTRAQELMSRIAALSNAQTYLGAFGEHFIVRAQEVQEGMFLKSWGRVVSVDREEIPPSEGGPCVHMCLKIEGDDEPKEMHGDQELIAYRDAPPHDAPAFPPDA